MLKKKHQNEESQSIAGGDVEVAHPSISVRAVFTVVGVLFSVLVFAFYFFRYNSASPFYNYYNKPAATPTTSLNNSVQAGINKAGTGKPVELRLTEDQIGTAICVACDTFPLKKSTLKAKPEGVIISGKTTTTFWGVNLDITFKPKAENGQIVFELTDFKAAGVSAPPQITQTYSDKLKGLFANIIPAGQAMSVTEVHSLVGSILIIGTKR
ncbi:MAG: hypothetical protein Q7S80_00660 [bacterium]|nr:hypothetical protein [bacterium]